MIRTVIPALTALLLNVQAGALCAVQAAAADLPDFTAASSWRGTLRFTVRCDRPDETYLLRLGTGAGPLNPDGPHLRLPLPFLLGQLPCQGLTPFIQGGRHSLIQVLHLRLMTGLGLPEQFDLLLLPEELVLLQDLLVLGQQFYPAPFKFLH